MKHLAFCNKVLSNQDVSIDELASFLIDYGICKGKNNISQFIQPIIQLVQSGYFDINYAIREYVKINNKSIYTWKYPNGVIFKQWVE